MSDNDRHVQPHAGRTLGLVIHEETLAEGEETPILHRTDGEVRKGDEVLKDNTFSSWGNEVEDMEAKPCWFTILGRG